MKSKSPKNLREFIEYWDKWHCKWWNNREKVGNIGEWPTPDNILGDKDSNGFSVDYYPEPYYYRFSPTYNGNNINDIVLPLDAIFLSINPGGAGLIDLKSNHDSHLIKGYMESAEKYSFNLKNLLKYKSGTDSTNSFVEHRENRANELIYKKKPVNQAKVLCVDLVPWHTKNQSEISKYIINNAENILKYILIPLANIANNDIDEKSKLHRKIFIRGVSFRDVINAISKLLSPEKYDKRKNQIKYYSIFEDDGVFIKRFSSIVTVVNALNCTFYIFTGGQGMKFPPLNKKVALFNSNKKIKTLEQLLLE